MYVNLTNFPIVKSDIIMLESSPPLMTKELFVEHATHKTDAIWDLCKQIIHEKF